MASTRPTKEEFVEKLKHKYTIEDIVEMILFETVVDAQAILDEHLPGHTVVELRRGLWGIKDPNGKIITKIGNRR